MFKYFWVGVSVRVVLILGACLHLSYSIVTERSLRTPIVPLAVAIIVFAVYSLVRYIERSNRQLANLVLSIKHRGFNENVVEPLDTRGSQKLTTAFHAILEEFRKLNLEKESNYRLLSAINENLQVGVIIADDQERIRSVNTYARTLLGMAYGSSIREIARRDEALYEYFRAMKSGDHRIVKSDAGGQRSDLLLNMKSIMLQEERLHIYLVYNISNELDEKEFSAWQDITNVLTHEIMNSVTPILSLTQAVDKILRNPDGTRKDFRNLSQRNIDDISESLETAVGRGLNLVQFVRKYRDFAVTPQVNLQRCDFSALVTECAGAVAADFSNDVHLTLHIPAGIQVTADPLLMQQVIINIVRNAYEALSSSGSGEISIHLSAVEGKRARLVVKDNGEGMDEETASRIFLPFFTTKAGGSGIGLSLARQIVRLHQGNISVTSRMGSGTAVTLLI